MDHLFLPSTGTNALKSSNSLNSPLVGKRTQNEPRVQGLNLTHRNSTMWRGIFASVTAQSHLLPPPVQLLHQDLNINSFFSILHHFLWSGKLGEDLRSSMKSQTVTKPITWLWGLHVNTDSWRWWFICIFFIVIQCTTDLTAKDCTTLLCNH